MKQAQLDRVEAGDLLQLHLALCLVLLPIELHHALISRLCSFEGEMEFVQPLGPFFLQILCKTLAFGNQIVDLRMFLNGCQLVKSAVVNVER